MHTVKEEKVPGDLKNFCNDEIHNLYSAPNIRVVKSRMRCAGHVASIRR
jgi:hypothetical protein